MTRHGQNDGSSQQSRVTGRTLVSEPARIIQVERVRVSEEQKSSVASAIRAGRLSGGGNGSKS